MRIAFFALLLFTCSFINHTVAQAGYIITQKGDTIKGEVKLPAFGRPKFKPANKANFRSFNPDTLREYQLTKDSAIFSLKSIPVSSANLVSKVQPLRRLEHGAINLYEYVASSGAQISTWYVSKGADSLIALKTSDLLLAGNGSKKDRRQMLSNLFADQHDIQKAFDESGKFDFDTIRHYIHSYNMAKSGIKH